MAHTSASQAQHVRCTATLPRASVRTGLYLLGDSDGGFGSLHDLRDPVLGRRLVELEIDFVLHGPGATSELQTPARTLYGTQSMLDMTCKLSVTSPAENAATDKQASHVFPGLGSHVAQDLPHGADILPVRPKIDAAAANAIIVKGRLGARLENFQVNFAADASLRPPPFAAFFCYAPATETIDAIAADVC